METFEIAPSDAVVHALLDILAPGSRIASIRLLQKIRAGKLLIFMQEMNRRSFVQRGTGKALHPPPHERLTAEWKPGRI